MKRSHANANARGVVPSQRRASPRAPARTCGEKVDIMHAFIEWRRHTPRRLKNEEKETQNVPCAWG